VFGSDALKASKPSVSSKPASVESVKKKKSTALSLAATSQSYRLSHSGDDSESLSSVDDIGKAGNKFMKKRPKLAPEIPSVQHTGPVAGEKPCKLSSTVFHFRYETYLKHCLYYSSHVTSFLLN